MKRYTLQFTAVATAFSLLSSGCANIKDDATRTKTEATLLGGGIGAGLGAGIGALAGGKKGAAAGAGIGLVIGSLIGHAYGSKVAARKAAYANNEAYRQACIAEIRSTRSKVADKNERSRNNIAAKRRELDQLVAQRKDSAEVKSKAVALNRAAASEIKNSEDRLKETDALIADHQKAIDNPENADVKKGDWNLELAKLRATRTSIRAQIAGLKQDERRSAQLAAR